MFSAVPPTPSCASEVKTLNSAVTSSSLGLGMPGVRRRRCHQGQGAARVSCNISNICWYLGLVLLLRVEVKVDRNASIMFFLLLQPVVQVGSRVEVPRVGFAIAIASDEPLWIVEDMRRVCSNCT